MVAISFNQSCLQYSVYSSMILCEDFQPSQRALEALRRETAWELMRSVKKLPTYHPIDCPNGLIDLSGAINTLMRDWIDQYTNSLPPLQYAQEALSYGPLFGSGDLLGAAAGFFNTFFNPSTAVTPEDVLAANGVTSLIDLVAWSTCNPGEGVLLFTPNFYMAETDFSLRAEVATVPVSTSHIPDPFGAAAIPDLIRALDAGNDGAARRRGIRCRALFICNPSNPQGRCYERETLTALSQWCTRRGMHLIVDEIYALSKFEEARPSTPFTSILSIDFPGRLPPQNVHCLYSLSKDLGMGGLRMGFLVTRNAAIRTATSKATWFTWTPRFSDTFSARLLSRIDLLQVYVTAYRGRLTGAYVRAATALRDLDIPFQPANAGLFIFIDLSQWVSYFSGDQYNPRGPTPELQLCDYLVSQGIFLNPGQVGHSPEIQHDWQLADHTSDVQYAGHDQPGFFRLVFTGDAEVTILGIQRLRAALDNLGGRPPSDVHSLL